MKLEVRGRLDPEMKAALAASAAHSLPPQMLPADPILAMRAAYAYERRYWNEVPVELASVEDRVIEAAGFSTRLRLYRPEGAVRGTALVYLHGGGWVVGSLDTHDRIMRLLAREAGLVVVGVDYALAPEHKFPIQLDQIDAVLDRLPELAGVERWALAGDSAGAHLSLALTMRRRDRGRAGPAALLLYYGAFGLADSPSRRLWGGELDGLGAEDLRFYREALLRSPEDAADPYYDLLAGDMHGLPPACLVAVTLDPLHDDTVALAVMLQAAGVPVELAAYDGVLHGFLHFSRSVPKAMDALRRGAAYVRARMAPPATDGAPSPG
jgi:acetyl esterase